jgi:Glutamate-1-semialdehyde aminotransferase
MKTLNYIDPIISPEILLDKPNHHTRFDSHGQSFSWRKSLGNTSEKRFIIKHANGAKITDTQGNEYIDFNQSQGANILGHAPAVVLQATEEALRDGINHGMPTLAESLLQKSIQEAIPSVDKVKLLNSGTEAVKGAIRLAKAFTGKERILVIEGANSTIAYSKSNTSSILPFNNTEIIAETFSKYKEEIAAIFVEPVLTSNGIALPNPEYLPFLREMATQNQALLIFDETNTGFRSGLGGAQGYFKVTPDITVFGKIIGGGFPIGAIGGRKDIFSAAETQTPDVLLNPITAIAGAVTLQRLASPLFYETLNHRSRDFIHYLTEITKDKGIAIRSFRSMFSLHFPKNESYELFHKKLKEKGVYLSPTAQEPNYISIAHLPEDLNKTLEVTFNVIK